MLGITWVERLKNGECRSRLCVQDFATTKSDEYFAPTPAEASTRILEAYAVRHGYRVRWADVGVAFLHAEELERVIVNPPAEWRRRWPGFMWLLKKCLYGRRPGPKRWYQTFRETLVTLGLEASLVQPTLFRHPTHGVVMEAHVDDIEITGPDEEVDAQRLGEVFLLKVATTAEAGTISVFLGRRKMRKKDALYTAPSRSLLESIVETLGLENCRKVKSPTEKLTIMDDDNDLLDIATSVIHRTCVGKLLFATKDRVDSAFPSKELARDLKEPRKRSWRRLKRAGRYLAGTLDLYQEMLNKPNQDLTMDIFVDSDWGGVVDAGDDLRKSTSKCLIYVDGMLVSSAGHRNNEL